MKKILLNSIIASSMILASCSSDDDTPVDPGTTVTAPDTYVFERDGASSVSFSGQTTRIKMAEELIDALLDNTITDANDIISMYNHQEGDADFSDADLNAASNQIKSKIGDGVDYFSNNAVEAAEIRQDFEDWITAQVDEVFPEWDETATASVAGGIDEFGGTTRYVSAEGVEYNQIIGKGLIGALMLNQIINDYSSVLLLDAGTNIADNDAGTLVDGKTYTLMEHYWDEAYGYLYGNEADTAVPNFEGDADSFLNKYLDRVDDDADFDTFEEDVYNAFKLGRAAIVAGDYDLRDEQAAIIRDRLSQVIGVRAVYYLKAGQSILETEPIDYASAFHDISEGLGFIYSLRFTQKPDSVEPYFTKAEVDAYLDDLFRGGNSLWDAGTADKLGTIAQEIADEFEFTLDQAAN